MYTYCIFLWCLLRSYEVASFPKSLSRPVAPFTTVFFSLSLSSSPTQTRSIIIMSHLFACGVWHLSLFFAKWWNVLLFYFSSLTHSAFGEGEIISNYRESRRCRPSSCACSYLLVCGRRMKRVGGEYARSFRVQFPLSPLSFLSNTCLSGASERDLSSRIGYLAAFGPI